MVELHEQKPVFSPGEMFGAYEIVRMVGAGGYAQVFEALEAGTRKVAVKVLLITSKERHRAAERLIGEAKILARASHINVVTYEDVFIERGRIFLVLEFLDGKTLRQLLHVHSQPKLVQVLRWGIQLCEALSHVHELGVVHRDVKPENIFLLGSNHDFVKLIDFGIAKFDGAGMGTSRPIGTPLYIAPDYLSSPPTTNADPRWDIYSLAMVLYECIAGKHPFVGQNGEIPEQMRAVYMHLKEEIPPLSSVQPLCPPSISDTIAKGLAREPHRRFGSAVELAEALRRSERELLSALRQPSEELKTQMAAMQIQASLEWSSRRLASLEEPAIAPSSAPSHPRGALAALTQTTPIEHPPVAAPGTKGGSSPQATPVYPPTAPFPGASDTPSDPQPSEPQPSAALEASHVRPVSGGRGMSWADVVFLVLGVVAGGTLAAFIH